jgi:hypothetical protein
LIKRNAFLKSNFMIRLLNWEYWPFGIIQAPLFFYWLWFSIRARSLFYFSASNPSILTGGMMGESKYDVLKLIPAELIPKTTLIQLPADLNSLLESMQTAEINFPCVFKPDLGERGWLVKIIHNESEAEKYILEAPVNFLIQELVRAPLEFGVYYVHKPNESKGKVVSITGKEMLSVTGNGQHSLEKLILSKDRAKLQMERLEKVFTERWKEIIPAYEKIVLNQIGNHCLGTCFLDAGYLINDKLHDSFNNISSRINGFYFGRFDLRCQSEQDLQDGNVIILELNGCGAEPAHIYQPGFPLLKAIRVLIRHMKDMFEVSMQNHRRGVNFLSFKEGRKIFSTAHALIGK